MLTLFCSDFFPSLLTTIERVSVLSIIILSSHSCPNSNMAYIARKSVSDLEQAFTNCKKKIHSADGNGWTILHEAARVGNTVVVKYLVWSGMELNRRTNKNLGATALWIARKRHGDNHEVVTFLESMGASELGPSIKALQHMHGGKIRTQQPPEKNSRNDLHAAARRGDTKTLKSILEKDRFVIDRPDEAGRTALHEAARYGHEEALVSLIEHGADVYAETPEGENARYIAVDNLPFNHTALQILRQFNNKHRPLYATSL